MVVFTATIITSCVTVKKLKRTELNMFLAQHIADSTDRGWFDCRQDALKKQRENDSLRKVANSFAKSLQNCNDLLGDKQKDILKRQRANDSLLQSLLDKQQRVRDLERAMASKDSAVNAIKNKLKETLSAFGSDLNVYTKNGRVHVSMSDKLLFKSGSIIVEDQGVTALQKIVDVANKYPNLNVFVEGHTDNVPLNETKKRLSINDNWDLSVLRATSITRHLITFGMKPLQILPSGRGEFDPVADNLTEEGKAKNRRTEIIISPNLEEIFNMLEVKTIDK